MPKENDKLYHSLKSTRNVCHLLMEEYKEYDKKYKLNNNDIKVSNNFLNIMNSMIEGSKRSMEDYNTYYSAIYYYLKDRSKARELDFLTAPENKNNELLKVCIYLIKAIFIAYQKDNKEEILKAEKTEEAEDVNGFFPFIVIDDPKYYNELREEIKTLYYYFYKDGKSIFSKTDSMLTALLHRIKPVASAPILSKQIMYDTSVKIIFNFFEANEENYYIEKIDSFNRENDQTKLLADIICVLYRYAKRNSCDTTVIDDLRRDVKHLDEKLLEQSKKDDKNDASKKRKKELKERHHKEDEVAPSKRKLDRSSELERDRFFNATKKPKVESEKKSTSHHSGKNNDRFDRAMELLQKAGEKLNAIDDSISPKHWRALQFEINRLDELVKSLAPSQPSDSPDTSKHSLGRKDQ